MPYFPTGDSWSWAVNPPKLSTAPPTHFPRLPHDLPPRPAENYLPSSLQSPEYTIDSTPQASQPSTATQPPPRSHTLLSQRSQTRLDNFLIQNQNSQRNRRTMTAQTPPSD
ncbi:hypothetical protein B0H34DRAFT_717766, partial [Crassisporium funariophilum]